MELLIATFLGLAFGIGYLSGLGSRRALIPLAAARRLMETIARRAGEGAYLTRTPASHGMVFVERETFDRLYLLICEASDQKPSRDYMEYLKRGRGAADA